MGYNVQAAVEAKHHLIVAHEVTNIGIDRDQLSAWPSKRVARWVSQDLTAVADRGYFKSEEILACHEAGISAIVPKTETSNATAEGRFGKADFIYDPKTNEYRCPAGERLIWRFSRIENGLKLHRYWSSHCQGCTIKDKCTPSEQRRVSRWEHEAVLEAMQARLDQAPREHAHPTPDGRTSLRDDQVMDGKRPFPDQDSGSSQYGNEPACARLQSETGDEMLGSGRSDGSDAGLKRTSIGVRPLIPALRLRYRERRHVAALAPHILTTFLHGRGQLRPYGDAADSGRSMPL